MDSQPGSLPGAASSPLPQERTPGAAPGTLRVPPGAVATELHAIGYGETQLEEHSGASLDVVQSLRKHHRMLWVHVAGLRDLDTLAALGELFSVHTLVLEDVLSGEQQAKVEHYGGALFLVTRVPSLVDLGDTSQVAFFVAPGLVLSFAEKPDDTLEGALRQWAKVRRCARRRTCGASRSAAAVLSPLAEMQPGGAVGEFPRTLLPLCSTVPHDVLEQPRTTRLRPKVHIKEQPLKPDPRHRRPQRLAIAERQSPPTRNVTH